MRQYKPCFKRIVIETRSVAKDVEFLWDVNGKYVYFPLSYKGKRAKKRLYIDGKPTNTFVFNSWFDNWEINEYEIDFDKQSILSKVTIGG